MADGSITFSTDLDNKELERKLQGLNKKIERLENKIYSAGQEKSPLLEQAQQLGAELDAAKAKLEEMRSAPAGAFSAERIADQAENVRSLQSRWDAAQAQVERYDRTISTATAELDRAKEEAGGVAQQLAEASHQSGALGNAVGAAEKKMGKFVQRVQGLAKRIFVFSMITMALRSVRSWLSNVIRSNDQAAAALARLKGALLTLAQPLLNVLIPAFITLANILTRVVAAAAQAFAMLFGRTLSQSKAAAKGLNAETKALKGTSAAAKKASDSLAAFDEINKLAGDSEAGGGGGADSGIAPDFNFGEEMDPSQLKKILELVKNIGLALLTWKLSEAFGLGLGKALALFGALYLSVEFLKNIFDMWANGVSWGKLISSLLTLAGAAGLFYIALGSTATGIALIAGGLALLATGFHDAAKNGWNLQNLFAVISGLLAGGLGIKILTGSWIPLLIAGIAAALIAFAVATGHGEELISGLKQVLEGFADFFAGVFTGDIERASNGIEKIFDGLGKTVSALISGLRDTILSFLDWLDQKTNGKFRGIIELVKMIVTAGFDAIGTAVSSVIEGIKQIMQGLLQFVSGVFTGDWNRAWEGVKNIFKGAWNGIVGLLEAAVNLIIRGLNWLISKMNTISFTAPSWVPGVGGKSFGINIPSITPVSIPRLATGAVIPPNREFMAVLGDQKRGTNIETPLPTMIDAFKAAMSETGGGAVTVVVNLDGREIARNTVKHVNSMARAQGASGLLR